MAEIHIKDGETLPEVARRLLDQAAHPDHVVFQPRSGAHEGGIFVVPDEEVDDLMARVEAARKAAERPEPEASADEEDEELEEGEDLTPTPPPVPTESGEPGQAPPDPAAPAKLSRAEQRRLDRRKAAEEAAATPSTADPAENTDKE